MINNICQFLKPSEEDLKKITHDPKYIIHGSGAKGVRKIFSNVPYNDFEKEQIKKFKQYIKEQKNEKLNKDIEKHNLEDSDYLKILYSAKCKFNKCYENLILNMEWRNNEKYHTTNPDTEELLKKGLIYLSGRDNQCRPVIIVDALQLNISGNKKDMEILKNKILYAVCYFLDQIRFNMFVGGKVENWFFMIDSGKLGLASLPTNVLGSIIKILQLNYGGCLHQICILNPSTSLSFGWGIVSAFLDEETNKKINFLKQKEITKLFQTIDKKYIEQKYTGQKPNLAIKWPLDPNIFYEQKKKENKQQQTQQQQQDESLNQNQQKNDIEPINNENIDELPQENLNINKDLQFGLTSHNFEDDIQETHQSNKMLSYIIQPKFINMY